MASFDSNMWYQVTEIHVGFGSVLTNWGGNVTGFQAWNSSDEGQFWQIMTSQIDSSGYVFRNKAAGTRFALGVAFVPQEVDPSRTQPRLQPMNPNNNGQKWTIGDFGNNTYYVVNVGNGTSYHLDVHPGNPVYMSSQTSAEPYDPRQHWEFQSIMPIDDSQWSQVVAALTTTSTGSATSTTESKSDGTPAATASGSGAAADTSQRSGLSIGAAVGIGVGSVAAVVVFISVLFHLRRYRANRKMKRQRQITGDQLPVVPQRQPPQVQEVSAEFRRVELPDEERGRVEMPHREREKVELPDSEYRLAVELPASRTDED